MKPTMALKPLVFAVTAVMAVAVYAGNNENGNGHHHHHGHGYGNHDPRTPYDPYKDPRIEAGASAIVTDTQDSHGNSVSNEGTKNTGSVSGSLGSASGNVGVNVAGGDLNQQANAAALATADEKFIFGYAEASTTVDQKNHNNSVDNYSTQNNASLSNSANSSSGNIGINVTAGNFNQQKNDLAAAVSGGAVSGATSSASQTSNGNSVGNVGLATYDTQTLKATVDLKGSYKGSGTGYVVDKDSKDHHGGGWGNNDSVTNDRGGKDQKDPLYFTESGSTELKGQATYQVLVQSGWKDPVTNNATISGSLNNVSGNVGANIAAGVGNQQSNSLSIAAGCKSCL